MMRPRSYAEVGERALVMNPEPMPYAEVGERALVMNPTDDPLMSMDTTKYELRTAIEEHNRSSGSRISSSVDVYSRVLHPYWSLEPGTYVVICVNSKNVPVFIAPIYGQPRDVLAAALVSGAAGFVVAQRTARRLPEGVRGAADIVVDWAKDAKEGKDLLLRISKKCQIKLLDFILFVSAHEWGTREGYGYLSYLDYGMLPPGST